MKAPAGVMTLELKRAMKAHKADTLYLLALPEPAKLGAEVKQPPRKIGEMAHTEEDQWNSLRVLIRAGLRQWVCISE
jgi:hypothetical protein